MLKLKKLCVYGVAAMSLGTPFKAALAQCGTASWYHEGSRTATGERYNPDGITAAHRSLPFGTRVEVRNQRTGRSVVVRINDRGPYIGGRIIDLSRGAKRIIGMDGLASVCLTVLGRDAPIVASADRAKSRSETRTAAIASKPKPVRIASLERRSRSASRVASRSRMASLDTRKRAVRTDPRRYSLAAMERRQELADERAEAMEERAEARAERRERIAERMEARRHEAHAEGFGRGHTEM